MAIVAMFEAEGATSAKYDAVIRRLGAKLMPIVKDTGIEAKPTVFEVSNILEE